MIWTRIQIPITTTLKDIRRMKNTIKKLSQNPATMDRSVGIVGVANSGKTVFLTSLIAHLSNHDPHKMRLKPIERNLLSKILFPQKTTVEITKFDTIAVSGSIPEFPYTRFRNALAQTTPIWPEKTSAASIFDCRFKRSDWMRPVRLRLLDFPGERFADVTMAGDFASWSDNMFRQISDDPACSKYADEFIKTHDESTQAEDFIRSYRLTLARFIMEAYKPLISPSVFLLDTQGKQACGCTVQEIADTRYSGLSEDQQFTPLSSIVRAKSPQLAKEFSKRYDDYKNVVIDPLMKELKKCHRLIVMIDIQQILCSGSAAYNDNKLILQRLLSLYPRDQSLVDKFWKLTAAITLPEAWRPGGVSRIAFVAPKADIVGSHQTDKLLGLLKQLVHSEARNYDQRKEYFTCAAISSTEHRDDKLVGHLNYDEQANPLPAPTRDAKKMTVRSTDLPEEWPARWDAGQFFYPSVYPLISARFDEPPAQESLGDILDYILTEDYSE